MATRKTKKDLEAKIAELEAKLSKLSSELESKPAEQAKPAPKPAEQAKPAEAPPKPAEQAAPPVTPEQALENARQNYPQTSFHDYRAKVTGYAPSPNRYYARTFAPAGKVPTSNWNEQKTKTPGYTQPSNQYFATRARLAYHPANRDHYGLSFEGIQEPAQIQTPPTPKKSAARGSLPKGF